MTAEDVEAEERATGEGMPERPGSATSVAAVRPDSGTAPGPIVPPDADSHLRHRHGGFDVPGRAGLLARATRSLGRVTAPLSLPFAGRRGLRPWASVTHVGRTSGRTYRTPVAIRRDADGFVIPLPWGAHTQWARNVLAAGKATVRWDGRDHAATAPEVIGLAEAGSAFNAFERGLLRLFRIGSFIRLRVADDRGIDAAPRAA